jgi:molecular chaperone DnaJ
MASQDWFDKDFYAVLGVKKDVTDAELKKAYRKLARLHHPDSNPGNAAAEARFKEISEANSVLSDKEQRAEYDQIRAMGSGARFSAGGASGASGGFEDVFGGMFGGGAGAGAGGRRPPPGGYEDIFGGLFGNAGPGQAGGGRRYGGPTKGRDHTASVSLEFLTAVHGDTVTLERPGGGKPIQVKIPAGVADGQKIRLRGKGEQSRDGGEAGDLVLTVQVRPHPVFVRDGLNLRLDVPVTFAEAALGATIEVPTLSGDSATAGDVVKLRVAAGTPSGRVLRVKGRGVTTAKGTGDLLATVQIAVPSHVSAEAAKHLQEFVASLPADNPRDELIARARA